MSERWVKKLRRLEREFEKSRLKRILDSDLFEVVEEVFDYSTLMAIQDLANDRVIKVLHGCISAGKEARVYWAEGPKGVDLAVKIYLISTAEFRKSIYRYIIGDPRFKGLRGSFRKLIYAWCSKEFRNLKIAYNIGVKVPKPIKAHKNVLVMEFINAPGMRGVPAPLIKDEPPEDPEKAYNEIINVIYKLYNEGNLVHADLSEYNIMNRGGELYIIDWGSAVKKEHPMAREFLLRDIRNVVSFFRKLGVKCEDPVEIFEWVIEGD